ncbi:hypothetical protein XELAEV_18000646mg [Xenopus laevis]|nr:hypothetical protein XELAEV_18000646mg [Xenopus laevis]
MHCGVWGPITPRGNGFIDVQSVSSTTADFRIAATSVDLDLDKSITVLKKLTLVGYLCKIFKNTAFVKGMFSSTLKVAKFEGDSVRTISGIQRQIKKALYIFPLCFVRCSSLSKSISLPIKRDVRHFNPLHIPKALQKALPFKSKPKFM